MSVEAALAAGRSAALQLMRDTCLIERKTGETTDPDTLEIVEMWETVYEGVCRVKPRSSREAEWGEQEVTLHQYSVHLPWDAAPAVQRVDRFTTLTSDDAWLLGRHLEVIAISHAGTSTARRILIEDRQEG